MSLWDNPRVRSALIGSLIGGTGMGLMHYLSQLHKDEEDRSSWIPSSILGWMGGAGAGYLLGGVGQEVTRPIDQVPNTPLPGQDTQPQEEPPPPIQTRDLMGDLGDFISERTRNPWIIAGRFMVPGVVTGAGWGSVRALMDPNKFNWLRHMAAPGAIGSAVGGGLATILNFPSGE